MNDERLFNVVANGAAKVSLAERSQGLA
jgi:hypothetical protein